MSDKDVRHDKNLAFGRYPCCDYLNNALRHLYKCRKTSICYNAEELDAGINEIIFAIQKGNGYFATDIYPDVQESIEKIKN